MDTPTPILRETITHPAAWTSASLGADAKSKLAYVLQQRHFDAIDALLKKLASTDMQAIRREDVDTGTFAELARDVMAILTDGAGLVVVQGPTRERYTEAEFGKIFWSMGLLMGSATVQNAGGDRITHVTQDKNHPTERGYRGSGELSPHTDAYAILGLMCVQRAESGGFSHAASALAIHNEILRTRPELLEPLYRGTRYASMDARGTPVPPTAVDIPLFSNVDGQLSCFFSRQNSSEAVRQLGQPMDPAFSEACDHFERLSRDDRFRIEFMLDPGEIMWVNNYVLVHARTEFTDSEAHKRDLLRLWLNNAPMRKVIPEMHLFAQIYDDIFKLRAATAAEKPATATS